MFRSRSHVPLSESCSAFGVLGSPVPAGFDPPLACLSWPDLRMPFLVSEQFYTDAGN